MAKRVMVLMLLATLAFPSAAQEADSLERIREQHAVLASELDDGVLKVTPRESAELRREQAKVAAILEENASLADFSIDERVALDNALQRINAIVVATRTADESQRVCKSEKATGSHVRKVVCHSKLEWEQIAEAARAYKSRYYICVPPGCGENGADTALRPQVGGTR